MRRIFPGTYALLILGVVIAAIYANTLESPFIFDDNINIVANKSVRLQELRWQSFIPDKLRFLPYFSFELNYYWGGLNVFGFHLVNIIIHIATAFVFYLLAATTLTLSSGSRQLNRTAEIAFAAALLWAVHPLQTNAVTYIVQRMTAMATLFCLLCVYSYVKARLAHSAYAKVWLYAAALLSGAMALLSKETSGLLPLMILGYEFFFLRPSQARGRHDRKSQILMTGMIVIFAMICWIYLNTSLIRFFSDYADMNFTLGQRLLTETRVILHYLSLLFLPLPSRLNLVYDFPLSSGFLTPVQTLIAFIGLCGLAALVFPLFRRCRLASFAILWFLLNLSIESSFIPLDIIFEHRMYMPSMFLILAAAAWFYMIAENRIIIVRTATLTAIILLSLFTWQRNEVWRSEITLWQDVVAKAPGSLRNNLNLGNVLSQAGRFSEAKLHLQKAIALGQDDRSGSITRDFTRQYLSRAHETLGYVYHDIENYPAAIAEINLAVETDTRRTDLLVTLGKYHAKSREFQTAYNYFAEAAAKGFQSYELYNNWAVCSFQLGKIDQAINLLQRAIDLEPGHPGSHRNLGLAYEAKGLHDKARQEMDLAARMRENLKNKSK